MKHFQGITNASDVKAEFRKLAKKLHPDVGGSEEQMKQLQEEYQQALDDIGHAYEPNATEHAFDSKRYYTKPTSSKPKPKPNNTYSWDEFDNAFNKAWENINRRNKQRQEREQQANLNVFEQEAKPWLINAWADIVSNSIRLSNDFWRYDEQFRFNLQRNYFVSCRRLLETMNQEREYFHRSWKAKSLKMPYELFFIFSNEIQRMSVAIQDHYRRLQTI